MRPGFILAAVTTASLVAVAAAPSALAADPPAVAQHEADETRDVEQYNLRDGLAIRGYDPVAYFPDFGGAPTKGDKTFEHTHRGVRYRFASQAHLDAFRAAPERFEPLYGGWCGWAMIDGDKVDVDPKSFVIQDGRLILFYKSLFSDTRADWKKTPESSKRDADKEWTMLSGEPARPAENDENGG